MQKEDVQMRYISVFATLSILLLIVFPAHAAERKISDEKRDEVLGLFGTLLVPSIFTTARSEKLVGASLYGRMLTGEGEVPDFDGSVEDEINDLMIFAGARLKGLGLTLGFGQGSEFEFSEPIVVSLDYKKGFLQMTPIVDAAVDAQYTMVVLRDEKEIEVSALGFGIFSINGMVSANLLMLEPYAGLTLNYVYLNPEDEDFVGVWKPVPKIGLQYTLLPMIKIGAEIKLIMNEHLDSAWMWDFGLNARF